MNRCLNFHYLLLAITSFLPSAAAADRPDLVVFLSDDHTITDSSLYGSGDIPTPNMDRIASAGMTFDQAFVVSPTCAPSRAALLTGLMPQRNGAEPNHSRPKAELKKLPAYFQELGYEVVSFGKVGHYAQTANYGFDLAKHYTYHDDVAVAEAVSWLRARQSDQPLCLFVGTNWPHVPWPKDSSFNPQKLQVPDTHVDTPRTRRARAAYYEAVKIMDDELGQVYDAAYEKLGADTLFIHTSDHGAQWPFGKWNLYDIGIRTPLIVTWPGVVQPNARTTAMVTWVDILPTMLQAAGGEVPQSIDGRSFLPVLRGETQTHRDILFSTHSGDGNMNVFPMRAARDSQWKYIRNLHPEFRYTTHVTESPQDTGYWPSWVKAAAADETAAAKVARYTQRPAEELYDLSADPDELHNLANDPAYAAKLTELRNQLDGWMEEMGDTQTVFGKPKLLHRR